jgi:hypothetical protein
MLLGHMYIIFLEIACFCFDIFQWNMEHDDCWGNLGSLLWPNNGHLGQWMQNKSPCSTRGVHLMWYWNCITSTYNLTSTSTIKVPFCPIGDNLEGGTWNMLTSQIFQPNLSKPLAKRIQEKTLKDMKVKTHYMKVFDEFATINGCSLSYSPFIILCVFFLPSCRLHGGTQIPFDWAFNGTYKVTSLWTPLFLFLPFLFPFHFFFSLFVPLNHVPLSYLNLHILVLHSYFFHLLKKFKHIFHARSMTHFNFKTMWHSHVMSSISHVATLTPPRHHVICHVTRIVTWAPCHPTMSWHFAHRHHIKAMSFAICTFRCFGACTQAFVHLRTLMPMHPN